MAVGASRLVAKPALLPDAAPPVTPIETTLDEVVRDAAGHRDDPACPARSDTPTTVDLLVQLEVASAAR
ncbi:hypothetical protein ACQP1P_29445 [Dactylosporangium sp. CA-052675]|uniref:hypothetical protein n=1 Tax=Dactylosporangium sp. CA-052675 TaxID=3239927 RepID=UPI003D8AAD28